MVRSFRKLRGRHALALAIALGPLTFVVYSQIRPGETPPIPSSLRAIPVPKPNPALYGTADEAALIALGKALFWDTQVGSDGSVACATCHFHAGADHRITNAVNPGPDGLFQSAPPNGTLSLSSFPFHRKADPENRDSAIIYDTDDRAGSAGVHAVQYTPLLPASPVSAVDNGVNAPSAPYLVNGVGVRQVEPRKAPTVFNAVFTQRNFWDGRASYYFNGVSPFGLNDPSARVVSVDAYNNLKATKLGIANSSLASQAVGPPLSSIEMSWTGRSWPQLGRKMLKLRPLALQLIDPNDSALGVFADETRGYKGLRLTYIDLIKRAFQAKYWNSTKTVVVNANGTLSFKSTAPAAANEYSVMEYNFSFFFGLAVQAYEATLVSDDAPFDRFRGDSTRFPDPAALTAEQQLGLSVFMNKGRCITCHLGAEFTAASISSLRSGEEHIIERMFLAAGDLVLYDTGFYNIGIRPNSDDMGLGGTDPFGNPLSFTLLKQMNKLVGFTSPINVTEADAKAINGTFKTSSLRNIELIGPYFHNGGESTLEAALEVYDRGGNFRNRELHADIKQLDLTPAEFEAVLAFLRSLTDERARYERAPFDHPQLWVPHGHPVAANGQIETGVNGRSKDYVCELPAVGAAGGALPLQTYEEMLQGISAGRAHTFHPSTCVVR